MLRGLIVAVVVIFSAASCRRPSDYEITTPTQADQIMKITASPTSAAADGLTQVIITVQLDANVKAEDRTVTFAATAGTFLPGKTNTATVIADALGQARAVLVAPDSPGTSTVHASVKDFSRDVTIAFDQPIPDNIFLLTASSTSIPADGVSRIQLVATLKFQGNATQRTVTFRTSAGTIFGPAATGPSVTVAADGNGVASVFLQSSTSVTTAQVTAVADNLTRGVEIAFTSADPASIVRLSTSANVAPADGATTTTVTATVAAGVAGTGKQVVFTTTAGTFVASGNNTQTVPLEGGATATVDLRSPASAATARVAATVNNAIVDAFVKFDPALPTSILLTSSTAVVKANLTDAVDLTAFLRRPIGTVSPGQIVIFGAAQENGQAVGSVVNVQLSSATGTATARFMPGTTTYRGRVTLTATIDGAVVGTTTVQVIDP